jgi:hypothetical protein
MPPRIIISFSQTLGQFPNQIYFFPKHCRQIPKQLFLLPKFWGDSPIKHILSPNIADGVPNNYLYCPNSGVVFLSNYFISQINIFLPQTLQTGSQTIISIYQTLGRFPNQIYSSPKQLCFF